MPNILDVFSADGYSVGDLTASINKLPYVPGRLGQSGLFPFKGITTTVVMLERKKGKISLIPSMARGGGGTSKRPSEKRDLIPFAVPHLPYSDSLLAHEIQGVREFGTESRLEAINKKVNEKLEGMRRDHEVTHEYHRVGAIQGLVLDADGSTPIIDLFNAFSISRQTVDFELDDSNTKVKLKCTAVRRLIEDQLGGVPFTGITAQVGNGFWDALVTHDSVVAAYERQQDGDFLRRDQRAQSIAEFEFCGILFQNYRGQVGSVPFIPNDEAAFYPEGVPELFEHNGAPADYTETVNTIGKPVYAKQEPMKFGKGIEFESQSNPAMLCSRPEVLIQGTSALPS